MGGLTLPCPLPCKSLRAARVTITGTNIDLATRSKRTSNQAVLGKMQGCLLLLSAATYVHGLRVGTQPMRLGVGAPARLLPQSPVAPRVPGAVVAPGRLIVVRHGESQWNVENRFTGWADVPLTLRGADEAARAAELILEEPGFSADVTYVSTLRRTTDTADIILQRLQAAGRPTIPCLQRWRLNERHYGALTGLLKREARGKIVGGSVIDGATLRHYRR